MLLFVVICSIVCLVSLPFSLNKMAADKKKADELLQQQLEYQRQLLAQQAHGGEGDAGQSPPVYYGANPRAPAPPSWKMQAAKVGVRLLVGAIAGHHGHHAHRHHNHHES